MWTSQMQMSAAEVLQAIGGGTGKPLKLTCYVGSAELSVKRAATEQAMQRNAAFRRASDLLMSDT